MVKNVLIGLSLLSLSLLSYAQDDIPTPAKNIQVTLLSDITAQGQKITGVALEYEDNILSGTDLRKIYKISTALDNQEKRERTVLKAYVNNQPTLSVQPHSGRFVIIELDNQDKNADVYSLKTANEKPMQFLTRDKQGNISQIEKVQATKIPQYYEDRLKYFIEQTGYLKLINGKTVAKSQLNQSAVKDHIKTTYLDNFSAGKIVLNSPQNTLHFKVYKPKVENNKKYPLTIFLHGSGQVGSDNIAQLLSSKGAISTLQYEAGFVLAPQYESVFDPFDNKAHGQKGGIHWQTENRQQLVLKMIDETLKNNPQVDLDRIYLIGLSRGSEGALNLLLKRPHFFAGALLMSGREVLTNEWIDGNASKENLAPIKDIPMWFFHSKEDKISPVNGSRINVKILQQQLQAANVKYTEFTMENAGDNGIINNNAHNTWDAVFNSPEVMQWLLQQKRKGD